MRKLQSTLPIGSVLQGRYCIEDVIGKGGFSNVYLVRDQCADTERENPNKGDRFALKELISQDLRERDRFAFEYEILKRLDNRALPHVYGVFEESDRAYLLMDYIEGQDLEMLRRQQPEHRFPLSQVLTFIEPIIEAMSYLHNQNPPIIHRDIKPSNIIVSEAGDTATLVDFGIAKEYKPGANTTATRHCSLGYTAPEQYSQGTNPRTDIYGLGATFYAVLTGTVPIDSLYRMTQLGDKWNDPLVPMNELTPSIPMYAVEAIHRALSIGSRDRFSTVDEFWLALNSPATDQLILRPVTASKPSSKPHLIYRKIRENMTVTSGVTPLGNASSYSSDTQRITAAEQAAENAPSTPIKHSRRVMRSKKTGFLAKTFPALLLAQIFLLLLLVFTIGSGIRFYAGNYWSSHHSTTVLATPTLVRKIMVQQTATVSPNPTPAVSGLYPNVARPYIGLIHNVLTGATTTMFLSNIQQNNEAIDGYFSGLDEMHSFSGVLDTSQHILFTIIGTGEQSSLFFEGSVQPDGTLVGTYCRLNHEGKCSGSNGNWSIAPS